ncbi:MAG: bactofilin family protein [Planctomycetota bacterium]
MARNDAPTVVAAGTTISGTIEGAEDILVQGAIKGSVRLDGNLTVEADARADADIEATEVRIHGILVGNVTASALVELTKGARVIGDLTAPQVIVEGGAGYRGAIDMGDLSGDGGRSRPSTPARKATPARQPAPAPKAREAEPEPDSDADAGDEPELPAAASGKKVSVKKRK